MQTFFVQVLLFLFWLHFNKDKNLASYLGEAVYTFCIFKYRLYVCNFIETFFVQVLAIVAYHISPETTKLVAN